MHLVHPPTPYDKGKIPRPTPSFFKTTKSTRCDLVLVRIVSKSAYRKRGWFLTLHV